MWLSISGWVISFKDFLAGLLWMTVEDWTGNPSGRGQSTSLASLTSLPCSNLSNTKTHSALTKVCLDEAHGKPTVAAPRSVFVATGVAAQTLGGQSQHVGRNGLELLAAAFATVRQTSHKLAVAARLGAGPFHVAQKGLLGWHWLHWQNIGWDLVVEPRP